MVTELVSSARQLYEESCELLRDKAHNLVSKCCYCNTYIHELIKLTIIPLYNAEITRGFRNQVVPVFS